MKHLIILNGEAGEGSAINHVNEIERAFKDLDAEIHYTTAPNEATAFLKERLSKDKTPTRVYSCGGDGTLHQCVNGVVGFDHAELALYAIGTGNDFAKIYGGKEKFLDLEKIIKGKSVEIDLSKVDSPSFDEVVYSINAINCGFDAMVGYYGNVYKEKGKKNPYDKALLPCILKHRFNKVDVFVDGEKLGRTKKILMANFCQGQYIGGKFHCAPKSDNTDGLIDVCVLNTCSLFTFLKILKPFTNGEHLSGKYDKIFNYKRGTNITITTPKEIYMCLDGEMYRGKKFTITSCPKAIKFVIPEE